MLVSLSNVDSGAPGRYERERAHHDESLTHDRRGHTAKYYASSAARTRYHSYLRAEAPGRRVLEYGCGRGGFAIPTARIGGQVTAIDLSSTAISRAIENARHQGVEVDYQQMNAEALTFEDDTFDLVFGSGILHHLDVDAAFAEVARVLRPCGTAIFLEPLGHNPLINLYRRLTPAVRSFDEHPLHMQDIGRAREHFGVVDAEYYDLAVLACAFRPFRGERSIRWMQSVDRKLFALPAAQRYAWTVVLRLSQQRARS